MLKLATKSVGWNLSDGKKAKKIRPTGIVIIMQYITWVDGDNSFLPSLLSLALMDRVNWDKMLPFHPTELASL